MAQQNHKTQTAPAPIGGLNVQDSLVAMPPTDATVLRNFFSQPYGLEVRRGYQRQATGLGDTVKSLIPHQSASNIDAASLFAFAGGDMFDVTTHALTPPVSLLSGLSNSRWNRVGISNASGYNVVLANGQDDLIWIHDDVSITRIGIAEIPNIDPKLFTSGVVHQKRIWWVEKDSTRAWYLDPEAIFGDAFLFDFGSQFTRGGKLLFLASWTLDLGTGPDDLLVAASSMGEVAIYSGSDPSSGATFSLSGVFRTGFPLGDRCFTSMAGDLLILTQYGLMSMNAAMASSDATAIEGNSYLSGKIQFLISRLSDILQNVEGWQLLSWDNSNMIVANVPLSNGVWPAASTMQGKEVVGTQLGSGQLVQSTVTKGWSQFDGMNAYCWMVFNNNLYFGDYSGNVWRAWVGYADQVIIDETGLVTEGVPVQAQCQTAFNFFGELSTIKHAKMVRPTFMNSVATHYAVKVNSDFNYSPAIYGGAVPNIIYALWNKDFWNQSNWAGGQRTQKSWTFVSGMGNAFALRIAIETSQPVLWASYDMMFESGTNI
jgi:hypothetical protein